MSMMIIYANNKKATIFTDCRVTCTLKDGQVAFYERGQKVYKFNKTIIGIIGNKNYSDKVIENIKSDSTFETLKQFVNVKYETIYDLLLKYLHSEKKNFENPDCIVAIAGINNDKQIVLTYFNTIDFKLHSIIPNDKTYYSQTFCNYNETITNQAIHNIINTTKDENQILLNIDCYLCENNYLHDDTININKGIESISL